MIRLHDFSSHMMETLDKCANKHWTMTDVDAKLYDCRDLVRRMFATLYVFCTQRMKPEVNGSFINVKLNVIKLASKIIITHCKK